MNIDKNHDPYGNKMSGTEFHRKFDNVWRGHQMSEKVYATEDVTPPSQSILSANYDMLCHDRQRILDRLDQRRDERSHLTNLIDEDEAVLSAIIKAIDALGTMMGPTAQTNVYKD